MKQLLKTFAPQPLIHFVRDWKNRRAVNIPPSLPLRPENLRTLTDADLKTIFADPAIAADWSKDSKAIEAVMPSEEIPWGVNPGDRRALYYLIHALKPRNVLEIGTHIGASTLHIVAALKRLGRGAVTTVDIIDVNSEAIANWKKFGQSRSPRETLAAFGTADTVTFHARDSLRFLRETKGPYDFIFLDGDHSAAAVYQEVSAALGLLRPGGTILLHDYFPDAKPLIDGEDFLTGPFRAGQRLQKECQTLCILPLGNLPWKTKKGCNITTLALVSKYI